MMAVVDYEKCTGCYSCVAVCPQDCIDVTGRDAVLLGAVVAVLQSLVEGLGRVQDTATGLWYQVVDKVSRADNWHDTSGSAMFVYALQRAIDTHRVVYLPSGFYKVTDTLHLKPHTVLLALHPTK